MTEEDVREAFMAVKEHIYQLVIGKVKGYVSVYYDTKLEIFNVRIKNDNFEFNREIRNAWDLITVNGLVEREVNATLQSYKAAVLKYYFR